MFGILIGTLCLLGLIAVVRGHRWRRGFVHGCGGFAAGWPASSANMMPTNCGARYCSRIPLSPGVR